MSEQENQQESQKTVVAFIAGLLIGGLLVWVFGGNPDKDEMNETMSDDDSSEVMEDEDEDEGEMSDDNDEEEAMNDEVVEEVAAPAANLPTGDGSIVVKDQPAGSVVKIDGATFPNDEGWIGVRTLVNGSPVGVLGVARFSKEQGLVPDQVELVAPTKRGGEYAVVYYTESGDRKFSLANDTQIEGAFETFTAQ